MGVTTFSLYQVDAFVTEQAFSGNPAAVCPLPAFLDDAVMQAVAQSNNLSETAFIVPRPDLGAGGWDLRWFTPEVEVALCGHATLASAHAVWSQKLSSAEGLTFHTKSGPLTVHKDGAQDGVYAMDFPTVPGVPVADGAGVPAGFVAALGRAPHTILTLPGVHEAPHYLMAVFAAETDVAALTPDIAALAAMGVNVIVTAQADAPDVDVVSRFFAPASGVAEDPVTGSAHCSLSPYWSTRLGRDTLRARQISARGGLVDMRHVGERVWLMGRCRDYLSGTVTLGL